MVHGGFLFVGTGSCIAEIITTTHTTVGHSGGGVDSAEWATTSIDCEPSIGTTRVIGARSDRTGTCGVATSTTSQTAGSGEGIVVLAVICTACASCAGGMVHDGATSGVTGI